PKNVVLETPLQSVFMATEELVQLYSHVLIVAEDNSAVTYVENYVADENVQGTANIITEVIVGQNAQVSFGAVDTLAKGITTYVYRSGVVARDGKLDWAFGCMNDGNTISNNLTYLVGDNSYATSKMVTIGCLDQKQ